MPILIFGINATIYYIVSMDSCMSRSLILIIWNTNEFLNFYKQVKYKFFLPFFFPMAKNAAK